MQHTKLPTTKSLQKILKKTRTELVFSGIFTAILALGHLLTTYEAIDITFGWHAFLIYAPTAILIWAGLLFILKALKPLLISTPKPKPTQKPFLKNLSDKQFWLALSAIIFSLYLPVIIASISVLTPDSWSSINQATGNIPLSDHHPVIFTAFVGIFIAIGSLFNSLELGLLLFSITQSALLALIFAFAITQMRKENASPKTIILATIFFAILPINAFAGVIMWKDILFAAFGLPLILLIRKLHIEKSAFFTHQNIICFISFAFLFSVFRHNGFYAYLFFLIFAALIHHKTFLKKQYLALLLTPVLLVLAYRTSVSFLVPTPSDSLFIVPVQQIARTVKYHGDSISYTDRTIINEILPFDKLAELYNPSLSDPVLWTLNLKALEQDLPRYVGLWFRLLLAFPRTFTASFLYNTFGYIYPFFPSTTRTDHMGNNSIHDGAIPEYSDRAYERGNKTALQKYRNLLASIIPLLFNIGFYFCTLLFALYIAIIKRKKELTSVFIILLGLFITTILGPVNGELRYLYTFVIATPPILFFAFLNKSPTTHTKKELTK